MKVTLFVEGGRGSEDLVRRSREGWSRFFRAAGLRRPPRVVPCGGRARTYKRFALAVEKDGPGRVSLMLVDSEGPVAAGHSVWRHLRGRDGWSRPRGAGDGSAFVMAQLMETWLLADVPAMRKFFGDGFDADAFARWPKLEDVPKSTILNALKRATVMCGQPYAKGKVSFRLLAVIDPAAVEAACPHARKLFDRLRTP